MMSPIKFISNDVIKDLLNIDDIVKIVEKVFHDLNTDNVCSPKKYTLTLPGNSSDRMKWINSMPAYLLDENVAGIKWVSVCSDNVSQHLPTTNGLIILNDLDTGIPLAVLDASLITHYRTAASILLAAKLFSPKKSEVVTLIGPGQEGTYASLFLLHEFKIRKFNVVYRSDSSFTNFDSIVKKQSKSSTQVEKCNDLSESISESDIVICSSTSMCPILTENVFSNVINENQFICGLTAFNDISTEILNYVDNLIFDDGENAIKRIEDVSNIRFKQLGFNNILSMTSKTNIKNNAGVNLYLPIGISAMDIAIASYFYKKSNMKNRGAEQISYPYSFNDCKAHIRKAVKAA